MPVIEIDLVGDDPDDSIEVYGARAEKEEDKKEERGEWDVPLPDLQQEVVQ